MPELPEVETVRRGLATRLVGRAIQGVSTSGVALRKPTVCALEDMEGWVVTGLRRHAKILFLDLEREGQTRVLSAHLGMTGTFRFAESGDPVLPHTHMTLHVEGFEVRFRDPRRFGWLTLYPVGEAATDAAGYGPDCLSDAFTQEHFRTQLTGSKAPVKAFLLDQAKQAGIGNIYACEALYRARVSPRRKACNVPAGKVEPLYHAIRDVLQESIDMGGTTLNDYVDTLGDPGTFIDWLDVFQREGQPCQGCQATVKRIVQSGRSTFYCSNCQR